MVGTAGGTALEGTVQEATAPETGGGRSRSGFSPGPVPVAGALLLAAATAGWAAAAPAAPAQGRISVEVTARTNGATGTVIEGYRADDGGITHVYAARVCTGTGRARDVQGPAALPAPPT